MKKLHEYIEDRYNFDRRAEISGDVYWSELSRSVTGKYGMVPFCSYGDYDNSCAVERSNYRVFMEMFGTLNGVYPVYGGYDSHAIIIDLDMHQDNEAMIDIISALHSYPCIDEEDMSNLEIEMQNEAWDDFIASDFQKALENIIRKKLDIDDFDDMPEISNEKLIEIRNKLMELTNTYFEIEAGGNVWLDIDRIVKAFDVSMLS